MVTPGQYPMQNIKLLVLSSIHTLLAQFLAQFIKKFNILFWINRHDAFSKLSLATHCLKFILKQLKYLDIISVSVSQVYINMDSLPQIKYSLILCS